MERLDISINDEVSGEARQFAPIRLTAGLG